ncbi:MAG TPA: SEC-C metal-binding domain-containing protein [Candidatus Angelobacter sp.]|nr:SEC-C metal-binding domain-containing protein [Candidatus Angelobacter sp.]
MSRTDAEAAQEKLRYWYSQFIPVAPPLGSAVRAFIGHLQPFPDGKEFAGVIAHLQRNEKVEVKNHGRLAHPSTCTVTHNLSLQFTPTFRLSFELLMLEFPGTRHPEIYAVSPEISRRRYPTHPHLRDDHQVVFAGKPVQALCTYLSSDGVLNHDDMRLVNLLDYTSMFLAKHMFWLATNRYFLFSFTTNQLTQVPNPGAVRIPTGVPNLDGTGFNASCYRTDAIFVPWEQQLIKSCNEGYWNMPWSTWLGKSAPHSPAEMYKQIDPSDECPCGLGKPYAECCRPLHALAS